MASKSNSLRWLLAALVGCLAVLVCLRWYAPDTNTNEPGISRFPAVRVERSTAVIPPKLSEEAARKELIQVVESQLAAFRDEDYSAAYTFAASSIKAAFPLPQFERMVKTGYPAIAQSKAVIFGVILDNGEEATVNVKLEGKSNRAVNYQYFLIKEKAGWKIRGVVEVKSEATTA